MFHLGIRIGPTTHIKYKIYNTPWFKPRHFKRRKESTSPLTTPYILLAEANKDNDLLHAQYHSELQVILNFYSYRFEGPFASHQ